MLVILISLFVWSTGSGTIIRILTRAFVLYKVGECGILKGSGNHLARHGG